VAYYPGRDYPVDAHAVAQSILTLLAYQQEDGEALALARKTAQWAIDHMQSERGYFYFQQTPWFTIRTPYMRWSQAWMHLALAGLLEMSSHD